MPFDKGSLKFRDALKSVKHKADLAITDIKFVHAVAIINIARECDIKELLPGAFYWCAAKLGPQELVNGFVDDEPLESASIALSADLPGRAGATGRRANGLSVGVLAGLGIDALFAAGASRSGAFALSAFGAGMTMSKPSSMGADSSGRSGSASTDVSSLCRPSRTGLRRLRTRVLLP